MSHLVDNITEVPFTCEQCVHYIKGSQCQAFDEIPLDIFIDAESHTALLEGQKGDYLFETHEEKEQIRGYIEA